jgi:2-dehydropantoate 2-reductase
MGAGGLGAYYGARLAQAGNDVVFIARGAHLAAMREKGLRVISKAGDVHLARVLATDDPATVGQADCAIVAVKLWDLEAAAEAAKPFIGSRTTVVSFQNGVEKDALVARIVGADRVVGGISYVSVKIAEPGVIEHTGDIARIVLGELDRTRSDRVDTLAAHFAEAGVDTSVSDDIGRTTWEKFVYLAALSGLTSLLRSPIGPIRQNAEARSLLRDALLEGCEVARAAGIALDPGFADAHMRFCDALPEQMRASMAVDLERGRPLELMWLSGAVERFGREYGVATPVSSVIVRALALYANGSSGR